MTYSNQISELVKKHGSDVIDNLQNEAIDAIKSDEPSVEFEVWEDGASIKNYDDALQASEDGSVLCEGQNEAEAWIENRIIQYIKENV